jgi:hypothetical protein
LNFKIELWYLHISTEVLTCYAKCCQNRDNFLSGRNVRFQMPGMPVIHLFNIQWLLILRCNQVSNTKPLFIVDWALYARLCYIFNILSYTLNIWKSDAWLLEAWPEYRTKSSGFQIMTWNSDHFVLFLNGLGSHFVSHDLKTELFSFRTFS